MFLFIVLEQKSNERREEHDYFFSYFFYNFLPFIRTAKQLQLFFCSTFFSSFSLAFFSLSFCLYLFLKLCNIIEMETLKGETNKIHTKHKFFSSLHPFLSSRFYSSKYVQEKENFGTKSDPV